MKIITIIAVGLVMLTSAELVNAEVTEVNTALITSVRQLPPPPPRPPLPHISLRRPPAPRRVVVHRKVVQRRKPFIKLPHIKLPRHPGPPPAPPRP